MTRSFPVAGSRNPAASVNLRKAPYSPAARPAPWVVQFADEERETQGAVIDCSSPTRSVDVRLTFPQSANPASPASTSSFQAFGRALTSEAGLKLVSRGFACHRPVHPMDISTNLPCRSHRQLPVRPARNSTHCHICLLPSALSVPATSRHPPPAHRCPQRAGRAARVRQVRTHLLP
jgi:hypothetical protein